MQPIPAAVPRASDSATFAAEPFRFLVSARAELGDLFVLREAGPIFSRANDCSGVVAVFGAELQRAVLTDIDSFAMPPSAAARLGLPERLARLNRSLHSMQAGEHAMQKRAVAAALEGCAAGPLAVRWEPDRSVELLSEMRFLAEQRASRVLFGEADSAGLVELLRSYFHLRREASSPSGTCTERELLVTTGHALDEALRRHIRDYRGSGVVSSLRNARLHEDDIVGHANILFISATEPVAVGLTWTLAILSQLPELRRDLRNNPALAEGVLAESLRLLPPNAFMVRVTSRAVTLGGVVLPERCEVVLCPLVAHRDERAFPRPNAFLPARWNTARPTAFEYFPFGAGGHACIGRQLALHTMKSVLKAVTERFDLVLDGDQQVDWRVHIQFMPRTDPVARARSLASTGPGGRLIGPVAELLQLDFSSRGGTNSTPHS